MAETDNENRPGGKDGCDLQAVPVVIEPGEGIQMAKAADRWIEKSRCPCWRSNRTPPRPPKSQDEAPGFLHR
jgi:hypothetical protein